MRGTMLPQQMLQYGNYVVGTHLPLITLQNVQLHIQMTQKYKGQRQTHSGKSKEVLQHNVGESQR